MLKQRVLQAIDDVLDKFPAVPKHKLVSWGISSRNTQRTEGTPNRAHRVALSALRPRSPAATIVTNPAVDETEARNDLATTTNGNALGACNAQPPRQLRTSHPQSISVPSCQSGVIVSEAITTAGTASAESIPHSIERSIQSSDVQLRCKDKRLYEGLPDKELIPSEVWEKWEESETGSQLLNDLREYYLPVHPKSQASEPPTVTCELRMSGYALKGGTKVTLAPNIWIFCSDPKTLSAVRRGIKALTWVESNKMGLTVEPIFVKGGAWLFSSENKGVDEGKLKLEQGIDLGEGTTLHINVEDYTQKSSACGLLCVATIKSQGSVISHRFCRIGGAVWIDMQFSTAQFGLSTAHAMLNFTSWLESVSFGSLDNAIVGQRSSPAHNIEGKESDKASYDNDSEDFLSTGGFNDDELPSEFRPGYKSLRSVDNWRNISSGCSMSFLGHLISSTRLDMMNTPPKYLGRGKPRDTDVSLLGFSEFSRRDNTTHNLVNTYGGTRLMTHEVVTASRKGTVSLLFGPAAEDLAVGELVPGSSYLSSGGETFTLRKIVTKHPLAEGTSGTWVADGDKLLGMIVAAFPNEPYALMVTADRLFGNIRTNNPFFDNIALSRPNIAPRPPKPDIHKSALVDDRNILDRIVQEQPKAHPESPTVVLNPTPTLLNDSTEPTSSLRNIETPSRPLRGSTARHTAALERHQTELEPVLGAEDLTEAPTSSLTQNRRTIFSGLATSKLRVPKASRGFSQSDVHLDAGPSSRRDEDDELEPHANEWMIVSKLDLMPFPWRLWFALSAGFLSASYLLFAVVTIYPALFFVWGPCDSLPSNPSLILDLVTLISVLFGALIFGYLADRFGRQSPRGVNLFIMAASVIGLTQTSGGYKSSMSFYGWFIFWRVLLGLGIGGEFSLVATIAVEWSPTQYRGVLLGAIFLMQSWGRLLAPLVQLIVLFAVKNSNGLNETDLFQELPQTGAGNDRIKEVMDTTWRAVIGIGLVPTIPAILLRFGSPETPRYLYDVRKNPKEAIKSMTRFFRMKDPPIHPEMEERQSDAVRFEESSYPRTDSDLRSRDLEHSNLRSTNKWFRGLRRYLLVHNGWKRLVVICLLSLVVDYVFFGINWYSFEVVSQQWPSDSSNNLNGSVDFGPGTTCVGNEIWKWGAIDGKFSIFEAIKSNAIHAILLDATGAVVGSLALLLAFKLFPLYSYRALLGVSCVATCLTLILAGTIRVPSPTAAAAFFGISQLYFNFGPNSFVFCIAPEIFPTRFRASFVGIAVASGKLGAIVIRSTLGTLGNPIRMDILLPLLGAILLIAGFLGPYGLRGIGSDDDKWYSIFQHGLTRRPNRTLEEINHEDGH